MFFNKRLTGSLISRSEEGGAVVDFVLLSVPLLLLAVSTMGIALTSYSRAVLIDAATEGSRFAGLADQDLASGILKARQIVSLTLGPKFPISISGTEFNSGPHRSVEIVIETSLASIGLLSGFEDISVRGGAVVENPN